MSSLSLQYSKYRRNCCKIKGWRERERESMYPLSMPKKILSMYLSMPRRIFKVKNLVVKRIFFTSKLVVGETGSKDE